tara:strand:+ start:1423 stop:2025 length:603 start_codon:yes stop_codon:yes gene_type:complete
MTARVAGLLTLMGGGLWMVDENRPVVYVNDENSFMSTWPSESIAGNDLPPECMFWNQSVVFSDEMCSLFVVNRAASAYSSASARAMRCAAEFGVECVLSPEIGLAMPAAFLYDYETSSMRMLIAPKLVPHESEQLHVRVSPPDSDGITQTRTLVLNDTVRVEYLDGQSKALGTGYLRNGEAYCVQLLRQSFEPACWKALD